MSSLRLCMRAVRVAFRAARPGDQPDSAGRSRLRFGLSKPPNELHSPEKGIPVMRAANSLLELTLGEGARQYRRDFEHVKTGAAQLSLEGFGRKVLDHVVIAAVLCEQRGIGEGSERIDRYV